MKKATEEPVEHASGIDKISFNIGSIKIAEYERKSAGIRGG